MSDIIKLLPDSVANQIAAGEVIQRPASVIKELVENSVDAGATVINVYIKDAGRTLIQVVDNGKGMSETDARMAFERHATSKIKDAGDLFSLKTMGFRGEALPSICAVSQVELLTKTKMQPLGTRLRLNASRVESQEPVACDPGCSILVKNLFFNVPARRKFLKSDNVELSNIMREFERLALVNNNIHMSIDTGSRVLDLRPASFKQRIADIWKNSIDLHLIPIDVDTSLVKITGFISRPEFARRRNPLQYLIVNGRNMRHPYFHKAITGCYDSLIASDTQPNYFLKFEVDPETIDVNIHPTKNEIKFEYEQDIWPILQASIKASLGKSGAVPSIDFSLDPVPVKPLNPGDVALPPKLDISDGYNPFKETKEIIGVNNKKNTYKYDINNRNSRNWDKLYADFMLGAAAPYEEEKPILQKEKNTEENQKITSLPGLKSELTLGTICIQHGGKYIITSSGEGLMIIDQRRAHIKILYEEFIKHFDNGVQVSQGMMFPDTIEIEPSLQNALEEIMPALLKAGFRVEYDEDNRWKILGKPAIAQNIDPCDLIRKMIDSINDSGENYGKEESGINHLTQKLALEMARTGAIKYGQKLTDEEMEHIAVALFSLPDPLYTPNGNKVFHLIEENNLNIIFK